MTDTGARSIASGLALDIPGGSVLSVLGKTRAHWESLCHFTYLFLRRIHPTHTLLVQAYDSKSQTRFLLVRSNGHIQQLAFNSAFSKIKNPPISPLI